LFDVIIQFDVSRSLGVATGLLPYHCSSVPEYACCVNKLRQNVGLQTWIWRHIVTSQNSIYPVTMTTIRHCSIPEFRRGGIQLSSRPGHHQTSARQWVYAMCLEKRCYEITEPTFGRITSTVLIRCVTPQSCRPYNRGILGV